MESKDELEDTDIKKGICYHFDEIIRDLAIKFENVLLHEKSYKNKYENIFIYDISYKPFLEAKLLYIRIK